MTWKAKIAYTDGRLDLMEPDSLVSPDSLPALTSPLAPTWRFRFDDLGCGLWVDAYAFSTDKTRAVRGRPAPAAPFEATVSLQLLAAGELESVHSVSVDGDVCLLRMRGALLNLMPFHMAADELAVARDKQPAAQIVSQVFQELAARRDETNVRWLCEEAATGPEARAVLEDIAKSAAATAAEKDAVADVADEENE